MRNRFDRHRKGGSLDMREGEMEKVSSREKKKRIAFRGTEPAYLA